MRTCEHSIPLDDYCPKCEAIERKTKQDAEEAALDAMLDRDEAHERATGDLESIRNTRIMGERK
jgi:hypothetical protein